MDPSRGSFRNVTVMRNGAPIASYDLYDFLISGRTQTLNFQDGDVVVVAPRGSMVGVTGQAPQRQRLRSSSRGQVHDRGRAYQPGPPRSQRDQRLPAWLPQRPAAVRLLHPAGLQPGGAGRRRPRGIPLRRLRAERHGQDQRRGARAVDLCPAPRIDAEPAAVSHPAAGHRRRPELRPHPAARRCHRAEARHRGFALQPAEAGAHRRADQPRTGPARDGSGRLDHPVRSARPAGDARRQYLGFTPMGSSTTSCCATTTRWSCPTARMLSW